MSRLAILAAFLLAFLAGCKPENPGAAASPPGRLQQLVKTNAQMVGYLYTADQPSIVAGFADGALQWRSDPQSKSTAQGKAETFSYPDKTCVGFEQKNLFMPTHGPERYLVCEALDTIQHRNNLPRSQDFSFQRGAVFLDYEPPAGTGYPQLYYLSEQK